MEIVAEISGNHDGKLTNCIRLIEEAKRLEVDRIKFQRFEPYLLATNRALNPAALAEVVRTGTEMQPIDFLQALYLETNTPKAWWPQLTTALEGHPWSCSVFSTADVDWIMRQHCPMLKVSSFELESTKLIRACAAYEVPLVLSGNRRATLDDLDEAMDAAAGAPTLTVLFATKYSDGPMLVLDRRYDFMAMDKVFQRVRTRRKSAHLGLSDHSPPGDYKMARLAQELGATMFERHLCLPDVVTADTPFSSPPDDFAKYIECLIPETDMAL